VREIRMLRAMRRELETEPRRLLNGHAGGNPGHSQGGSYGPLRQFPTLPRLAQWTILWRHALIHPPFEDAQALGGPPLIAGHVS